MWYDICCSVLSIYYHKSTTFRVQYPLLTFDNYPSYLDVIFMLVFFIFNSWSILHLSFITSLVSFIVFGWTR